MKQFYIEYVVIKQYYIGHVVIVKSKITVKF